MVRSRAGHGPPADQFRARSRCSGGAVMLLRVARAVARTSGRRPARAARRRTAERAETASSPSSRSRRRGPAPAELPACSGMRGARAALRGTPASRRASPGHRRSRLRSRSPGGAGCASGTPFEPAAAPGHRRSRPRLPDTGGAPPLPALLRPPRSRLRLPHGGAGSPPRLGRLAAAPAPAELAAPPAHRRSRPRLGCPISTAWLGSETSVRGRPLGTSGLGARSRALADSSAPARPPTLAPNGATALRAPTRRHSRAPGSDGAPAAELRAPPAAVTTGCQRAPGTGSAAGGPCIGVTSADLVAGWLSRLRRGRRQRGCSPSSRQAGPARRRVRRSTEAASASQHQRDSGNEDKVLPGPLDPADEEGCAAVFVDGAAADASGTSAGSTASPARRRRRADVAPGGGVKVTTERGAEHSEPPRRSLSRRRRVRSPTAVPPVASATFLAAGRQRRRRHDREHRAGGAQPVAEARRLRCRWRGTHRLEQYQRPSGGGRPKPGQGELEGRGGAQRAPCGAQAGEEVNGVDGMRWGRREGDRGRRVDGDGDGRVRGQAEQVRGGAAEPPAGSAPPASADASTTTAVGAAGSSSGAVVAGTAAPLTVICAASAGSAPAGAGWTAATTETGPAPPAAAGRPSRAARRRPTPRPAPPGKPTTSAARRRRGRRAPGPSPTGHCETACRTVENDHVVAVSGSVRRSNLPPQVTRRRTVRSVGRVHEVRGEAVLRHLDPPGSPGSARVVPSARSTSTAAPVLSVASR